MAVVMILILVACNIAGVNTVKGIDVSTAATVPVASETFFNDTFESFEVGFGVSEVSDAVVSTGTVPIAAVSKTSAATAASSVQTGTVGFKVSEDTLRLYGNIETAVKSVSCPVVPDVSKRQVGSCGTLDWSTGEQGYVIFIPAVDSHLFYLVAPDGEYVFIAQTYKNQPMKVALLEGTGVYRYLITVKASTSTDRTVKYENAFLVSTFDAPLANYLVFTPYGDYENAPNVAAKASELWDGSKDRLWNIKAIARYVGSLRYDMALKIGTAGVYANPDRIMEAGGGVCNEMSKLCVAMLRSQGVPAYYQGGNYNGVHAWVMAWVELDSVTTNGVTVSRGAWVNIETTEGAVKYLSDVKNSYTAYCFSVN